jgi:single-strand DNA-binding protein
MSDGMNKVILIGNLGADPELKYTQGGQAVLKLRLATTESYFDKASNERKSTTEWHTVIVWGKRAEALNKILSKGRTICVEGSIQYRQWEDANGDKRYATDIKASEIILLGGGNRSAESRSGGEYDRANGNGTGGDADAGGDDFGGGSFGDDDIPF